MGPWQDINPGNGGSVKYQLYGTAPYRRMVISWYNVPMFSCTGQTYSSQIKIYETTNVIETHILNKSICSTWNSGNAVHGLHNSTGTVAVIVPGRNNTVWSVSNEGKRFTPNVIWANTLGQTFPYNSGSLTVNPVPSGTTGYFLKSGCSASGGGAISDTTWLTLSSPTVTVSAVDDNCTQGIGSVSAVPGTSGNNTFSWSPGGATTATVNNLFAGTYTVTMTDAFGCTATGSATVNDNPVTFAVTSTLVSCAGGNDGTATATVTPATGNVTYQWSNGQTTQTATGLTAGTYTCTITAGNGCVGNVSVTVTEIPGLTVNIVNQTNATCNSAANGTAAITATQGTLPYTYTWTNSASTGSNATDLAAGPHVVTVTDANGCNQSVTVTISEPSPLSIVSHTPDTQICPNASIQLSATGTGGSSPYTFTWSKNGVTIGTGTSINVTPANVNTQYCVTLSEQCGSPTTQACLMVTYPQTIIPSVVPNSPRECVPGTFVFMNNSQNSQEIATTDYLFTNGSTYSVNGGADLSVTFPNVGYYGVGLTVTSIYGCTYTATIDSIVQVVPLPTANFNISKNPASWFETTIQTADNSTDDVVSWQWASPGATIVNQNGPAASITYPEGVEGAYPIILTVTTGEGCSDSITLVMSVVSDIILYVPNSFTPDNDEHNQSWKFYAQGMDMNNFHVEIYNRWGEIIWESYDPHAEWDGYYGYTKVPPGTYTWRISFKEKDSDGRKYHTGYINVLR